MLVHPIVTIYNFVDRTDLIISAMLCEEELSMNYCNIQLKAVVKYKIDGSDEIFKSSCAEKDILTAQSMAELLASIRYSKCPTMQFTTDLDQNFHIMILSEEYNETNLIHYDLSGTEAIAMISIWLLNFCPHKNYTKTLDPQTKDLNLLANIQRAHQNIKEKMKSFNIPLFKQNPELVSVVEENYNPFCSETEEDSKLKCQKWVDSLILNDYSIC